VFLAADLDGTARVAHDLADRAADALGGQVDVLVNNAAEVSVAGTPDTDEAALDRAWAVNVMAPFFLVARLAPQMASRGSGVVMNIGSWMAGTGTNGLAAYTASKGALNVLTRTGRPSSGRRVSGLTPSCPAWCARTPAVPTQGVSSWPALPTVGSCRPRRSPQRGLPGE